METKIPSFLNILKVIHKITERVGDNFDKAERLLEKSSTLLKEVEENAKGVETFLEKAWASYKRFVWILLLALVLSPLAGAIVQVLVNALIK
jgi:hypothetical protein